MPFIPALIIGAAAVGGAAISSSAAKSAAKTAAATADKNNVIAGQVRADNLALAGGDIAEGNKARDLISSFLNLGGDREKAHSALQTYLDSTGYQFRLSEGTRALEGSRAASRTLGSGAALRDLNTFAQGTAAQGANDWLGHIEGVANRGSIATGNAMGVNNNFGSMVSNNNQAASDASANAKLASAKSINSLFGTLATAAGTGIGQSSYGNVVGSRTTVAPQANWNPFAAAYVGG